MLGDAWGSPSLDRFLAGGLAWDQSIRGIAVKQGYRLILADKDGVLVGEFQLTENDLADPEAFVATLKRSIEQVEEEET